MRNWDLADAEERLSEVVDLALADGPQRVASHGNRPVVVLDEAEYQRLAGQVTAGAARGFGGKEIFEIMQNSPLAQGIRDGDIPEDWLERSQEASRATAAGGAGNATVVSMSSTRGTRDYKASHRDTEAQR